MKNNFSLKIADINFLIKSRIYSSKLQLEKNFHSFINESVKSDYHTIINWQGIISTPEPEGRLIYNPGSLWKVYRRKNMYNISIYYNNPEPVCVLKTDNKWNNILIKEKISNGRKFKSIINTGAGELIFRTKILLKKGIVIHSSCIDDNERGFLIAGHSGEGKSTICKYWKNVKGSEIINEDRTAVRIKNKRAVCFGIPWGGTIRTQKNHNVELRAIFLIKQSKFNRIKRLNTTESMPLILARTFLPYWDKYLIVKAFNTLKFIVLNIPVYELHCRLEPEKVIKLVRSVL